MKVLKIAVNGTVTIENVDNVTDINPLVAGKGNWAEFYPAPAPYSLVLAVSEFASSDTPVNLAASHLISEISDGDRAVLRGTVVLFGHDNGEANVDIDLTQLPSRVTEAVESGVYFRS